MKKTHIMDVKGRPWSSTVIVHDEDIERVRRFEYIGSLLEADGDDTKEFKWRLTMACNKLIYMENVWKATQQN